MSEKIAISDIDDSDRLRPANKEQVAFIAASIEQSGLEQPMAVRRAGEGYKLVIGKHRLDAVKQLGWTELVVGEHVIIVTRDDFESRISEINENLARHELNALDRAVFLAARAKLYEEQGATRWGGDRRSKKVSEHKGNINRQSLPLGFGDRLTPEIEDRVGLSDRAKRLAVQIGKNLNKAAIEAVRGTMVEDNQQELLALSELDADKQVSVAKQIKAGTSKTVLQAKIALKIEHKRTADPDKKFAALLMAWLPKISERALKDAKKAVLTEVMRRQEPKP
jgi:ParB family transcriptional regulator, chromosome partitioning protein